MGWFSGGREKAQSKHQVDPDLAQTLRAMELSKEVPVSNNGTVPAPDAAAEIAAWMRSAYARGEFQAIWEKRVELGYDVSADGLSHDDWFSLNALGALSALQVGMRDHPVTPMAAGYAQSAGARTDEQRAQLDEIKLRYFG